MGAYQAANTPAPKGLSERVHVDRRWHRGAGVRVHGRADRPSDGTAERAGIGYAHALSTGAAYSRVACGKVLDDHRGAPAAVLRVGPPDFVAGDGIEVERGPTDNCSRYFRDDTRQGRPIPYPPPSACDQRQVERFNAPLLAGARMSRAIWPGYST